MDESNTATAAAAGATTNTNTKPATTPTPSTSVKLLIKASNQQFDDQIVESDLMWTVKRLKTQLSQVYPSKPAVVDQKLIYSGQLLNDSLLLKDVIRSYKDVYTQNHIIHLVCTPKFVPVSAISKQKPKTNITKTTNMASTVASANAGPGGSAAAAVNDANAASGSDGLRLRSNRSEQQQQAQPQQYAQLGQMPSVAQLERQQQFANLMQQNAGVGLPHQYAPTHMYAAAVQALAAAQCYPQDNGVGNTGVPPNVLPFNIPGQMNMHALVNHQTAMYNWMQHVYTQYMEHFNRMATNSVPAGAGSGSAAGAGVLPPMINPFLSPTGAMMNPVIPFPNPAATAGLPTQFQVQAPPSAAVASPQPQIVAQEAPAQQQQAAAAPVAQPRFPQVQEEPDNRDWLESFFSIIRLAVFLTILYFNSSPLRCLMVILIGGGIYLYHIGALRLRHERNNNNINRNNNAAADQIRQGVQQVQRAQEEEQQQQQQQQQQRQQQNYPPNNEAEEAQDAGDANRAMAASRATEADNAEGSTADAANADAGAAAAVEANAQAGENNESTSVISFLRTFVVTFFTSLLPEAPAAL